MQSWLFFENFGLVDYCTDRSEAHTAQEQILTRHHDLGSEGNHVGMNDADETLDAAQQALLVLLAVDQLQSLSADASQQ